MTIIKGEAQIRRGGLLVNSDEIRYNADSEQLEATGDVRISRQGSVFSGPQLKLNLATDVGTFEQPTYELVTNGARGAASSVEFNGTQRVKLNDATYTTCHCNEEGWYLQADSLVLDNETKEGQGKGADLYFQGLRVARLPLFWFPISDARRSGFLAPSLALTSSTGFEVAAPYYWNMAPNRDLLWTPRLMSKRGLQIGAHLRYLEPASLASCAANTRPMTG